MKNFSYGIGDPYWYEWTVGLIKIIEMLHPESDINSVTLQASDIQGWDDIRVEYNSGKKEYYQIKHSRTEDSITFGDIVSISNGKSLLSHLAKCWKEITYNKDSKFILFTNREIGNRKATIDSHSKTITRPPLKDFFNEIKLRYKKHQQLTDVQINDEYKDAYNQEWLANLSELNEEETFKFINQLEIEAGQESLVELEKRIIEKISTYLGINSLKAKGILQSLDHALRNWSTSLRGSKEKITKEDVYQKLCIPTNEIVGNHELEPPYPFFKSREKEINELISSIEEKSNKIIFLTGPPGIGKTSLISKLANSREPYIHLRYYTFKPISPENDLLPADAGRTTKAASLWGDLLSELRILFKENLAKYNFPIRNDFISDVNKLRDEVVRLSVDLSKRTNQRTVICIDGIDHAARAEIDLSENYLETLIPPDNIPEEILFIISGQPPDYYDKYPVWLKSEKQGVKRINITNLTQDDIKILLENESVVEKDYASQIIYDHTLGNTLSVLYAIETVKKCSSIEDAKKELDNYQLKDGLNIYYNNIWTSSTLHIKINSFTLSKKIACIFSLTAARLNGSHFSKIIPDYNEEDWSFLLSKLSPLIIKEEDGYRVLHNDAKVFFTKIIHSLEETIYADTSFKILELYLGDKNFNVQLHNEVVHLLNKAKRTDKILDIISPRFIIEAYVYKCSISGVEEQIKLALNEAVKERNISKLHNVTCCIKSFNQLQNELQSTDERWDFFDASKKFTNELRVIRKELWNLRTVEGVLDEALYLFRVKEFERSKSLLERWFKDLKFSELIQLLPEVEVYNKQPDIDYENLNKELESFFHKYGQIIFYIKKSTIKFDSESNFVKNVLAQISSGILEELIETKDFHKILYVFEIMPNYSYPKDFDKVLLELIKKQDWTNAFLFIKNINLTHLSDNYKIFAIFVSLLSRNDRLISKWYDPYKNDITSLISDKDYSSEYFHLEYTIYTLICFILGWKDYSKDISEITEVVSKAAFRNDRDERKVLASKQLFRYSALIGRWFSEVFDDNKKDNFTFISETEIRDIINNVLTFNRTKSTPFIRSKDATMFLLSVIIYCAESTDQKYNNIINEIFYTYYDDIVYDYHLEIIWTNLYKKGFYEKCEILLSNLLGEKGKIWEWQNDEKKEIINDFIKLTKKTPFADTAKKAFNRLQWYTIAFSGHKDYNLYYGGIWLEEILKRKPHLWKEIGIKLLNLSEKASELGDNRASNYVNKLLMFGALKTGPMDALQLYNQIQSNYEHWRTYLTDAIIDYFDQFELTSEKIKLIWLFCCGYLYWSQYGDRKEIYRLKKTILDSQIAKSNPELISFMNETNPIYFNIDYLDKIDENVYQPIGYDIVGSIEFNLNKFFNSDRTDTELLTAIIKKIKDERPPNFNDIIAKIYEFLLNEQEKTYWGNNRFSDKESQILSKYFISPGSYFINCHIACKLLSVLIPLFESSFSKSTCKANSDQLQTFVNPCVCFLYF